MDDLEPIFQAAGREWNVDPRLLRAMSMQESGGNPSAKSFAGAQGLMQIMPQTQKDLGVIDPNDPVQSIYGAAKYMNQALTAEKTPEAALNYYHGGPGWRQAFGPESAGYAPGITKKYLAIAPDAAAAVPTPAPAVKADPAMQGVESKVSSDPFSDALHAAGGGAPGAASAPADDAFSKALTQAQSDAAEAAKPPPMLAEPTAPGTGGWSDAGGNEYGIPTSPNSGPNAPKGTAPVGDAPIAQIVNAGVQGAKEGFGTEPLGLSAQNQQGLVDAGIYNGPNEYNPLKGLNRAIINPLAAGADLAMRAGGAALRAGQGVVAQTGAALGAPILGRDLAAIPEAFMGHTDALGVPRAAEPEVTAGVPATAAPNGLGLKAQLQARLESGSNPLAARAANDVFANPLARNPDAAAPAFVPPGSSIPAPTERPAFIPPAAANDAPLAPAKAVSNPLSSTAPVEPVARTVPAGEAPKPAAAQPTSAAPITASPAAQQAQSERTRLLSPAKQGVDATEYVPGVQPTAAEIMGTPEVSINQKRTEQSNSTPFAEREEQNNTARLAYLDKLSGSEPDVNVLRAQRTQRAEQDLQSAWQNKTAADPSPVVSMIDNIMAGPEGVRPVIQNKLAQVRESLFDKTGNLQTDPEMLYGARKAIDDTLSKAGAQADPLNTRVTSNLTAVKAELDKAIEPAAPGFDKYLANYSAASKPIDQMELLQGYAPKLTNGPNRQMTFAKFDSMMKNIVADRAAPGISPAKSIDAPTMDGLFNLHADLKRKTLAEVLAKVKGSDTSQMLEYGKKLGLTAAHGLAAHALPVVGNALVHYGNDALSRASMAKRTSKFINPNVAKILKKDAKKNPLAPE